MGGRERTTQAVSRWKVHQRAAMVSARHAFLLEYYYVRMVTEKELSYVCHIIISVVAHQRTQISTTQTCSTCRRHSSASVSSYQHGEAAVAGNIEQCGQLAHQTSTRFVELVNIRRCNFSRSVSLKEIRGVRLSAYGRGAASVDISQGSLMHDICGLDK